MKRKVLHLLYIIIITAMAYVCFSCFITKAKTGVPSVGGYSIVTICSGSMQASGINVGDRILIHKQQHYQVGDYVVFRHNSEFWFHEIIEIRDNGYLTKGSSNPTDDGFITPYEDTYGVMVRKLHFVGTPQFAVIMIMIPYLLFMIQSFLSLDFSKSKPKELPQTNDNPPVSVRENEGRIINHPTAHRRLHRRASKH